MQHKHSSFKLFNWIFFILAIAVGYDDRRMMLNGKFSYNRDNQRALPFNVHIKPLPADLTKFQGSSSEYTFNFNYIWLTKATFFHSRIFEIINENLLPKFIPISFFLLLCTVITHINFHLWSILQNTFIGFSQQIHVLMQIKTTVWRKTSNPSSNFRISVPSVKTL